MAGKPYKKYECKNFSSCEGLIAKKSENGYCRKCYSCISSKRQRDRYKASDFVVDSKKCATCNEVKGSSEFTKATHSKDGLFSYCKICKSFNDRYRKYGVTRKEYENLLKIQANKCKLCDSEDSGTYKHKHAFSVDHCHITGKIRGLLCNTCNRGLGLFKDNIKLLEKAVKYLKEAENVTVSCRIS